MTDFSKMVSVIFLMPVNPLPPQAYTKETLSKAYAWLLNQSPAIKEIASSQDMLISLYLKAQRNGDASLEAPSIQNFKQELKSLANILGDLQPQAPATMPPPMTLQPPLQYGQKSAPQQAQAHQVFNSTNTTSSTLGLDSVSLQAVSEVRQTLNLSSDTEALRALIALGHKQFKKANFA